MHVILWGVETGRFQPGGPTASARYGLPENGFAVLAIRGVRDVQNALTIVRAFALVAASRPDAALGLMLGPEVERLPEPLAAAIAELGIGDRVRPIPSLRHEELPELYRAADVCVSVPSSDGTSIAVLEAMACGRPVILSDIPANRELAHGGQTAVVVAVREEAALAEALGSLAAAPERRAALGRAARDYVVSEADSSVTLARAEELYRSLAAG